MTLDPAASPAFGQANLSNCEREQIHFAGSIQPHGALLAVRESDGVIVQESGNAAAFLGYPQSLRGAHLRKLGGDLWSRSRLYLDRPVDAIPVALRCAAGARGEPLNALLHRAPHGGLIVELEYAGPPVDYTIAIQRGVDAILSSSTLRGLCDSCAGMFRDLTGYDRVMIYRFDDEGHGEVFSETKRPELEAFFGNRYPASDIPQIARRLYERNRVRLLADVDYTPSALEPRLSPLTGEELDMSMCFLRSVSPIHLQYLKNMGVAGTLVVSLMVGGELWGLISCHHYSSRLIHFEMRAVCELLAEVMGTRIAALESFAQGQADLSVRRLEQRMIESVTREGDWRGALFDGARSLLLPLNASGAALLFEGKMQTVGDVPGSEEIRALGQWLQTRLNDGVFVTSALSSQEPAFAPLTGVASGVIATRISSEPGELLIWFRKERVRTVTWGGNPFKAPSDGDDPNELSPRRSFAQWHQVVEGTSDPWTAADRAAARLIGESVTDVVIQFRSLRILVAQDQLEHVLRQVHASSQQIVVAAADGAVLEANSALNLLLGLPRPLRHLDELSAHFADPDEVEERLRALRDSRTPWRGEALLVDRMGGTRPIAVRADPVLASRDRILGYVILFTDLAERRTAEAARRNFRDNLLLSQRRLMRRIDSSATLAVENVMSSIIDNAQLAALEIADGLDTASIPDTLESVRASVARAAEVLEQISIGGASDAGGRSPSKSYGGKK
ncbi:GAF domain-containing protein [Methylocystis sp.]|uniref:GAF domain-containing protein n=1 Tax=Methylocystis sp. TaxID=1911079 RepID=UPI002734B30E|nr:GAF domain-containing protein [Methylocystis sp.]MDP3555318.1 GAF domain-containing protein [Methylocystis sp.]